MSHQPERKAKDCLNCGTIVQGRFCHVCGQENVETKTSFFGIVSHFFNDITHFDGKFFVTLKHLAFRPGFVPKQFTAGKRQSYLNPIRMYLFTSAFFFLIFFSLNDFNFVGSSQNMVLEKEDRQELLETYTQKLKKDPANTELTRKIALLADTTKVVTYAEVGEGPNDLFLSMDSSDYKSPAQYDSIQKALPADQRDGWFGRSLMKRFISIQQRYDGDMKKAGLDFLNLFLHKMPYLFFVSLPFFALFLKLLYYRQKHFFYSDHFTFIIYHFIFSYCLFIVIILLARLEDWLGWNILNWMIFALIVWWALYFFKGLRNFYMQGKGKTFLKFLLLNIAGYFLIVALFIVLLIISVFQF